MLVPPRLRHASTLLGAAVVIGATTGLLEGLILWTRHWVFGAIVFASRDLLWMTPLAYMGLFALIGLLLAIGGLVAPRVLSVPVSTFLLVAFGFGCVLLPFGQLDRIAAAILAAGVGIQAARLAKQDGRRAARLLGRGTAVLAGLAVLAGGVGAVKLRTDASGLASVRAAGSNGPNVLIVVWDTVRAMSLSLYGHERPTTPRLEALAAQSTVFDRAFSPSPWTLPGHAALFTGLLPHETSASWYRRLDDAQPTLAEIFAEAGYATGGFVANHHYTSYDSGLARGFRVYEDYPRSWEQIYYSSAFTQTPSGDRLLRSRSLGEALDALRLSDWGPADKRKSDRKHSDELNDEFLSWLDDLDGRPFFGFLNYFDAHEGYWSPDEFLERFPSDWEGAYEAAIAYQDDRLWALLDELDRRGVLDNTVVVFTADHGEMFGEHQDLFGHAKAVYDEVVHVPLLVRYPGSVPAGVRVSEELSLRHVAATILELAGLVPEHALPGTPLSRAWKPRPDFPYEPVLVEVREGRNNPPEDPISRGPVRSIVHDGWQYILNGDGVEELYRYESPDSASVDLLDDPEATEALASLRAILAERQREAGPLE